MNVEHAETPPPTRRERLRTQTLEEIERHAFELVDADGADAVSLAAIAKAMGMSAPALYRYFPSRDALLAGLVTAAYAGLSRALEQAATHAARRAPAARLRAVVAAYRDWALAHPRRYKLIFGNRPDDVRDSTEAIATISRGMDVLLAAVLDLRREGEGVSRSGAGRLDAQLASWAARSGYTDAPLDALRSAVLTWTRLHGLVSLEIVGAFDDMHLDASLLLDAEVDAAVQASDDATASHRGRPR